MLAEGATFIDIGAISSRPGAEVISEEEELHRIIATYIENDEINRALALAFTRE